MKAFLQIFSLVLLLSLVSCLDKEDSDPLDVYREIAYAALTFDERATLTEDWKKAEVSAWVDGNYLVTFKTTQDEMLGPISVVVDPDTGRVIEKLPRF